MRHLGLAVRVVLATLAPVARLAAQDTLALDASVSSVVSGGVWEQGAVHGSYRLAVVRGSTPNDSSRLYLQWLQDDRTRLWVLGSHVVAGMGGGIWALDVPTIGRGPTGGWVARIAGEDARAGTRALWIIALGAPGSLPLARRY